MDSTSPPPAPSALERPDTATAAPAVASTDTAVAAVAPAPVAATPVSGALAMRASDQERDQVAAALGEALATGRLTTAEHAERIESAYAARTLGELAPLTRDLPAVQLSAAPAAIERQQVAAVFSKVNRGGRWVAGRHTELRSTFGALIVDLSDAVLPGREIVLEANSFCGKLIVTVPANAQIIDEGGALFGKRLVAAGRSSRGRDSEPVDDANGPVIRVTGRVRFGKVVIRRAGDSYGQWPWRMG